MDEAPMPGAGTHHLLVVKKTLRQLYAPILVRNDAIEQAVAALARLERQAPGVEGRSLLAPAA